MTSTWQAYNYIEPMWRVLAPTAVWYLLTIQACITVRTYTTTTPTLHITNTYYCAGWLFNVSITHLQSIHTITVLLTCGCIVILGAWCVCLVMLCMGRLVRRGDIHQHALWFCRNVEELERSTSNICHCEPHSFRTYNGSVPMHNGICKTVTACLVI